jgi:hypothetical protein
MQDCKKSQLETLFELFQVSSLDELDSNAIDAVVKHVNFNEDEIKIILLHMINKYDYPCSNIVYSLDDFTVKTVNQNTFEFILKYNTDYNGYRQSFLKNYNIKFTKDILKLFKSHQDYSIICLDAILGSKDEDLQIFVLSQYPEHIKWITNLSQQVKDFVNLMSI